MNYLPIDLPKEMAALHHLDEWTPEFQNAVVKLLDHRSESAWMFVDSLECLPDAWNEDSIGEVPQLLWEKVSPAEAYSAWGWVVTYEASMEMDTLTEVIGDAEVWDGDLQEIFDSWAYRHLDEAQLVRMAGLLNLDEGITELEMTNQVGPQEVVQAWLNSRSTPQSVAQRGRSRRVIDDEMLALAARLRDESE